MNNDEQNKPSTVDKVVALTRAVEMYEAKTKELQDRLDSIPYESEIELAEIVKRQEAQLAALQRERETVRKAWLSWRHAGMRPLSSPYEQALDEALATFSRPPHATYNEGSI